MLVNNADVDQAYLAGVTPRMIASALGRTDAVRMLISAGANVNGQDMGYRSNLLVFASVDDVPNRREFRYTWPGQRQTSLMLAARGGHVDVVDLLLAAGAKTDTRDADGRTALTIAQEEGQIEIVERIKVAQ